MIGSFVRKLKLIGIEVDLAGNYPWVYITHINGKRVYETFLGNHGFTAFFINKRESWSDRREVFKLIRSYCEKNSYD